MSDNLSERGRREPARRDVLGLAGALAGAAFAGPACPAAPPERPAPGRIDVHAHPVPPDFIAVMKAGGMWTPNVAQWSVDKAVADMDRAGTATAMLSIPNPGAFPTTIQSNRRLARVCNEFAAGLVRDRPGRFGNFAYLPLPDIDGALAEIAYAFDVLKADGVFCWTSYGDRWFGDPLFNPVYEELNRRGAVVYTHPRSADCCNAHLHMAPEDSMIEWQTDTTRAVAQLIFAGTAMRYPRMQVIFSHGGGTMPFLVRRMIKTAQHPQYRQMLPDGFLPVARRYFYDTAQQTLPAQLFPLKDVATVPQILFGTDYPYGSEDTAQALADSGLFSTAQLKAIGRGNALRLFPRLG
jgi:predicted TIM-barrel fold metal-dependent hydrolase